MGYRSDVMALVYPSASSTPSSRGDLYEQLKTLMNTTFKDVMDEWGADSEWVDRAMVLKFTISDVKWYPNYSAVSMFKEFLSDIHHDMGYVTEFIRIGEEVDDVEQDFSEDATYHLRVCRSIESEV